MKEERMTFKVTNDEGQEVECEALFTFESDETNKHYIAYTDNSTEEENPTLIPIETEKEWKIIETIFEQLQAEAGKQAEGDSEQ